MVRSAVKTAIVWVISWVDPCLKSSERFHHREGSLLKMSNDEVAELVKGCDAVASCLGHNLSFKGLFLPPWRLVRNTIRRL